MELQGIRRHPVKAMAGESLDSVTVSVRGLRGDRWYAVADAEGNLATGKNTRRFRKHDEIFEYGARTTGPDDDVEVYRHDGAAGPWMAGFTELDADLSARMGEPVRVVTEDTDRYPEHMDDSPVSLIGTASLAWFAQNQGFTVDDRRIRANFVVSTETPFEEETWSEVQIGNLRMTAVKQITRCRVVDLGQNHTEGTIPLLKTLGRERGVKLGVYFAPQVDLAVTVSVGDPVTARI